MPIFVPFTIAYALADRFAGGGWPALDARLPGRAAFWGALACAGIGFAFAGLYGLLMGVVFLAWRTPGWDVIPGGSITPKDAKGYLGTFLRHLLIPQVLAFAVAYWTGHDRLITALAFAAFAVAATLLAAWLGREEAKAKAAGKPFGQQNTFVELGRGLAFGLAVAAGAMA